MFREIFGNMYSYDDDYLTALAMGMFFSFKKNNEVKIKVENPKKPNAKGRRIFDQMKEQAEDVEFEEIID